MEGRLIARGRGRLRKTIGVAIKKNLEVNGLPIYIIHDKPLGCCLIHAVDST